MSRISCPAARIVLRAVYGGGMSRLGYEQSGIKDLPQQFHERPNQRMLRLREQLRESGLAQMLAGGESFMPDITLSADPLSKGWYRLLRPRSYEQLALHLVRNLDWYLDQRQQVQSGPLSYVALAAVFILVAMLTGGVFAIFNAGGIALFVSGLISLGAAVWGGVMSMPNPQEMAENRFELYHYLAEAYRDQLETNDAAAPQAMLACTELSSTDSDAESQRRAGETEG